MCLSDGATGIVAFFGPQRVTEIRRVVVARVPMRFFRVDRVAGHVGIDVEAQVVEDEELELGSEIGHVGDAGLLQVRGGPLRDVARIARVRASARAGRTRRTRTRRSAPSKMYPRALSTDPATGPCRFLGSLGSRGCSTRQSRCRRRTQSSSTVLAGTDVCCHIPGMSMNLKSTIFAPCFLMKSIADFPAAAGRAAVFRAERTATKDLLWVACIAIVKIRAAFSDKRRACF